MQDEINEKVVALSVKGAKLTAEMLQKAIKAMLAQAKKQQEKQPHGKQTLKQLAKQNAGLSNIEITEGNIKAFEQTAKKYGIDFALKKDSTETPPRYLVFFKGRDADALTAAFKEFSAKKLTQEQKPSIRKALATFREAAKQLIPLGENLIPIQRGLTTSSTAIFIPFITQELFQRGAALYYGLNALSNNMILCDRKKLKNPNGLILGTPGSGKSFAAKREMTNAFLITDDDIIICDPEAEYFSLVQRLGGQVIRLSPAGKGIDGKPQYVNPMDINLNYSEDDNPLALKSDFILSLCELVIGGKEGLQPVEKTVIDRAVRNVYRPFLADPDPAKMPILGDLYNELLKQPEPEATRIAAAMELYVSGSLNVFNHRTNVELSNRLVCFDIKQLGKQLKKLGMLIVQDQVWNRVTVNRAEKKATRYYMDEFHLLLKEEQTAAYSVEIWKRFRKWGGIPTAITQNVKDLLSSREVENIFENSDFVLMLNQAQGDRAILAKQLNISPQQMKYVTHTEAGEGLIFYGNVVLPFIDRFPTDTELYRLLTTKPEEVSKA